MICPTPGVQNNITEVENSGAAKEAFGSFVYFVIEYGSTLLFTIREIFAHDPFQLLRLKR
jgi:hypothetical protein